MNQVQVILKGVDQFSATFGKATKDFASFRSVAISSAAAIAAALTTAAVTIGHFTKEAINMADEMGKASQRAGVAVDQFSALAYAGRLADLSMEQLVTASKAWSQAAASGQIITGNFAGDLLALADQFAATADGATKVNLAVQTFGKAGQALIPLLNQGSDALREQFEEAKKFGLVVGPQFAANAQQFNDAMTRMKGLLQGVWAQVAERVLPTIVALAEAFLDWAKNSGAVETAVSILTQAVLIMADTTKLAMEAWVTFTGLVQGKSFAQIGAELELFNSRIEELKLKLSEPVPPPQFNTDVAAAAAKEHADKVFGAIAKRQAELEKESWVAIHKIQDEQREYEAQIRADDLLAEDEKNEAIIQMAQIANQRIRRVIEDEHKAEMRIRAQNAQGAATFFGNLAQLAAVFGKKGFAVFKALRIAEAIASTYAGAARALAEFPWPYSIAVAASVVAAGIANVVTIASTQPGQAHGGLSYVPEDATYRIAQGERILSPRQNQDLTRFIEGRSGSTQVVVMIGERTLLDVVAQASRDGRLEIDARALT